MVIVCVILCVLLGIAVFAWLWEIPVTENNIVVQQIPQLRSGDVLHVRVGISDMGDGLPPWVPTRDELVQMRREFEEVLPDDVEVIATHYGVEAHMILVED